MAHGLPTGAPDPNAPDVESKSSKKRELVDDRDTQEILTRAVSLLEQILHELRFGDR